MPWLLLMLRLCPLAPYPGNSALRINSAVLWLLVLALCCAPGLDAQAQAKPTIAILRFGFFPTLHWMEGALLDTLALYGWLSANERETLRERQDLQGEKLDIFWGDADFDYSAVTVMVDQALDREADVLVTLSTPVTQAAVNQTLPLEEPPAILFTGVSNPVQAGVMQAPCLKPAHITGSESTADYQAILPLLMMLKPNLQVIGTLFNSSEATGIQGARQIQDIGEGLGLEVKVASVVGLTDIQLATDALIGKGVEAIVLPDDLSIGQSMLLIATTALEYEIPVVHASLLSVYFGATMTAGPFLYFDQGAQVGRLLVAYLQDELDIAATAVNAHSNLAVALNLDNAELLNIEISDQLLALADVTVEDGITIMDEDWGRMTYEAMQLLPLDEQREVDRAYLAGLRCTPEMIAEQQAALAKDS